MSLNKNSTGQAPEIRASRDWVKVLSGYREPATTRSAFELAVTLVPFILLWALAWAAMSVSYWLTFGLSLLNAGFLLRLFAIQHDCGHGAFFKSRTFSDWVGRVLGVLTVTPYDVWRHTHSVHHSSSGNLCRRGMGDIHTMTVQEYQELSWIMRLHYRLYRNPLVLFGLGPGYIFLLQNRIPLGLMGRAKYWISAMATNAAILAVLGLVIYFGGLAPVLLIFLPSTLLAATAGVWLFYVQHQFEDDAMGSSCTELANARRGAARQLPLCVCRLILQLASRRISAFTMCITFTAVFRFTDCQMSCVTILTLMLAIE